MLPDFPRSRSADYIAMSLWPSRGLSLEGFELKSFRNDWLSEKKNPQKAENIFQYCDYFWLLTTSEDIAKMEEIPDAWGWLCIKGAGIKIMKQAPKLNPLPVSKHFMAAMLKRASCKEKFVHIDSIEDRIEAAREAGEKKRDYSYESLKKEHAQLLSSVSKFEEASGVKISERWMGQEKIGEAVKFIINGGSEKELDKLRSIEDTAQKLLQNIKKALIDLPLKTQEV